MNPVSMVSRGFGVRGEPGQFRIGRPDAGGFQKATYRSSPRRRSGRQLTPGGLAQHASQGCSGNVGPRYCSPS